MTSKIGAGISIRRRKSKLRSISSFPENFNRQTIQVKKTIPDLIHRVSIDLKQFVTLSKQIKIKPHSLTFNFSSDPFDVANTIFDKNYATAKLRGIENKHTLKRANQELSHRSKKAFSNKASGFSSTRTSDTENVMDSYQQRLDAIIHDQIRKDQKSWAELLDDSDQELIQVAKQNISPQKGLLYFDQLQNHPKILNYTLRKMKSRKTSAQIQFQRKESIKKQFRQGIDQFCEPIYPIPVLKKFYSADDVQRKDPLQIEMDKLYRKVYKKQSRNFQAQEARQDPILSSFLQQQERIAVKAVKTIESKQNCEKMKVRFDKILSQMYRNNKKYRISEVQQKKSDKSLLNNRQFKQRIKMLQKQRK